MTWLVLKDSKKDKETREGNPHELNSPPLFSSSLDLVIIVISTGCFPLLRLSPHIRIPAPDWIPLPAQASPPLLVEVSPPGDS